MGGLSLLAMSFAVVACDRWPEVEVKNRSSGSIVAGIGQGLPLTIIVPPGQSKRISGEANSTLKAVTVSIQGVAGDSVTVDLNIHVRACVEVHGPPLDAVLISKSSFC
jgi:hypothetical protein